MSIIKVLALLLSTCFSVSAAKVLITWWANPEPDIAGYRVYVAGSSDPEILKQTPHWVDVGNVTNYVHTVYAGAPYFVAVQAYNTSWLYSDLSEPLGFALTYSGLSATATVTGTDILGNVVSTDSFTFTQPDWSGLGNQFFTGSIIGGTLKIQAATSVDGPWTPCYQAVYVLNPMINYQLKVSNKPTVELRVLD